MDEQRNSMDEWLQSEAICIEYAEKALRWVNLFFAPVSKTFRVAYLNGDEYSTEEEPNASSSTIGAVVFDCEDLPWSGARLRDWATLIDNVKSMAVSLADAPPKLLFPLKTFGVLPAFSTSYLAELLSKEKQNLRRPEFALLIRKILFEAFSLNSLEGNVVRKREQLHPFIAYHMAKALQELGRILRDERNDSFLRNIQDDGLPEKIFISPGNSLSAEQLSIVRSGCGFGEDYKKFKEWLATGWLPGQQRSPVERALQTIEDVALSSAVSELVRHADSSSRKANPSSLAFALAVLSHRNPLRHDPVVAQGLSALCECCLDGTFAPGVPFNIDEKGRALFVPTIEIANATLDVILRRIESNPSLRLDPYLDAARKIQDRLVEEYNEIELIKAPEAYRVCRGWCSDRAPSKHRVDSWVTVHVLGFFLRRLSVLRWAKRQHVLSQYSWMPHSKCKPKWNEVVDPDKELAEIGVKQTIWNVANAPPSSRDKAPVFLLYGPPGTSKTSFAHALAAEKHWDLIMLSPSDFITDSLDLIEQRARKIFHDLMNVDKCVILLDEMDSLIRDREMVRKSSPGTIIEFVIPALLPKLQQLRDHAFESEMAVFFVSNYYESIDRAIARSGRIDNHLLVLPYSRSACKELATRMLAKSLEQVTDLHYQMLSGILDNLPCALVFRDVLELVKAICRAIEKGQDQELVLDEVKALGISPESYSAENRPNARNEVLAFLARLQNCKLNFDLDSADKVTVDDYLAHTAVGLRNSRWSRLIENWKETIG